MYIKVQCTIIYQSDDLALNASDTLIQVPATSRPNNLTIQCTKDLALTLFHQEKFVEATPIFQEALKLSKEICGPENPTICDVLNNYSWLTEYLAGKAIALKFTTAYLD